METDICNYTDDTTIYACDKTLDSVIASLESYSGIVIQWFGINFMKLNAGKCYLLILGRTSNQQVTRNIEDSVIENTEEEKLLGVVIDKNLLTHILVSNVRRLVANFLLLLVYQDTWTLINLES